MTLVVAEKRGIMLYVVSDTHVTHGDQRARRPLEGVVKSCIVTSQLCVSFAGADYADDALKSLRIPTSTEFVDGIVSHFLEWHIRCNRETSFILAFGEPHYRLFQIKGGEAHESDLCWIGSDQAFSAFHKYRAGIQPLPGLREGTAGFGVARCPEGRNADDDLYKRLTQAMWAVIRDENISEVGGFLIPVATHEGRFEYMDYTDVVTHPLPLELMAKSDRPVKVPFGTTAEGGFSLNFIGIYERDPPLPAIFIVQGECGLVFDSKEGGILYPRVYRGLSPLDFEETVARDFGGQVGCMFVNGHSYVGRAKERLKARDATGAHSDCNRAISLLTVDIDRNPSDVQAYNSRGLARRWLGDLTGARGDFEHALGIDSTYDVAAKNVESLDRLCASIQ